MRTIILSGAAGLLAALPAIAMAQPAPGGQAARTEFQSSPVVQTTTPPPTGDYPLCDRQNKDRCVNPREAGKNWGNRPLDHWPGQSATEKREAGQKTPAATPRR